MFDLFDKLEADLQTEHKEKVKRVVKHKPVTCLISMKEDEKERFTNFAHEQGLSLSAFARMAFDEYISRFEEVLKISEDEGFGEKGQ